MQNIHRLSWIHLHLVMLSILWQTGNDRKTITTRLLSFSNLALPPLTRTIGGRYADAIQDIEQVLMYMYQS